MLAWWAFQGVTFHRVRSLLTITAIALVSSLIMGTLGFYHGYQRALKRNIDAMGYQILVVGKGCPHEAATLLLRGGAIPMYIQNSVADYIATQPEVQDMTRFLWQVVAEEDGRTSQLFIGIDDRFISLKPDVKFQRGGWFSSGSADEAIVGFNVAEFGRLSLGDEIRVRGHKLVIVGVLDKLGTQDDGSVFIPLALSQTVFERRDRLTGIGIRLRDMNQAGPFIERLYEIPSVQVVRMSQVLDTVVNILNGIRALLFAFAGMCLVVALTGVFNVSLIAVHERKAEMGVLRAIGCSRPFLFSFMWSETLLLSLSGATLGSVFTLVLGNGVEWAIRSTLPFVPTGTVIAVTPTIVAVSWATVVPLCLLAGVYPAWQSSKAPPLQSIRGGA